MGDVDELNSLIGWAGGLDGVQNELFDLGADLSVPFVGADARLRITDEAVSRLEQEIDAANETLADLKSFVLPGGSERAARALSDFLADDLPLLLLYFNPTTPAVRRNSRRLRIQILPAVSAILE